MTSDVAPQLRGPFSWKRTIGSVVVVGIGVGLGWWIWSRPTTVVLADGRTLVIDKITLGPSHVAYAPFTFERLWYTASRRLKAWPNTTYHSEKGMVGVFHHTDPKPKHFRDDLYVVDRDGWWWEAKSKGAIESDRRLSVFPQIDYPSSPRFEVWNDGVFMGGGPLRFTPPVQEFAERIPSPFPIRFEKGSTLIVLDSIDVTTRDDVRPNSVVGQLKIETFRHGQPTHVRLSNFMLSNAFSQGCQCPLDEERRFTTEVSPYGRCWAVSFLAWRDEADPLNPEAMFDLDPTPHQESEQTKARSALKQEGTEPELREPEPEGPPWHDKEVDGVRWRFAVVPPGTARIYRGTTWAFRKPFSEGPEYKVKAGDAPLLICEKEPGRVAALRIEFRRPDGELFDHAIVDGQVDESRRLEVGCPKLDPTRPYKIHVGVHIPVSFHAVVRPRVQGGTRSKPAVSPATP